ncbi:MAG: sugar phosphate nucleotidyltransferase [Thermoplasmatota archaeon]
MKGVVMAGGEGTRLRPLTDDVPKPFLRAAGKPMIEYGIERLVEAGAREIVLTTFYKPERLMQRLGGGHRLGCSLFYSVEDTAMGTAGGVKKAASFLDETFVVMSGDVLSDVDIGALVKFHRAARAEVTIALTEVEDPTQFGIVGLAADGRVERFLEKPKKEQAFSNLVNAGIYVVEPSVLGVIPTDRPFDWAKDVFAKLLAEKRPMFGHRLSGLWIDAGRPADLLRASRLAGARHPGGAFRAASARVGPKATVAGSDVYEDAVVEDGADVDASILYEGAHVFAGARVRGSILGAGARIEAGAQVERCVIGAGARVAAGERLVDEKRRREGAPPYAP